MSDYVAIAKLADPKEQSQSSIVTSGGSRDTAALELFEAKHAKGGSTKGKSLGFIGFQFNPKEITITKAAHWERKPVAKIVSASEKEIAAGTTLEIRSLKGHRVLTSIVSQSELADEMFGRR